MRKFGVYGDYWETTAATQSTKGNLLKQRMQRKNICLKYLISELSSTTYPYFHDGSVESLEEATKIIAKLNLNIDLTKERIKDLTTFMKALCKCPGKGQTGASRILWQKLLWWLLRF